MPSKNLAATSAAVTATAVVGGLASSGAADPWFQRLRKPPFQPPPQTFGIVWPLLYAGIAAGSADALDHLPDAERPAFAAALAANLTLNAGWTWVFFKARRPVLATVESAVLTASTIDLTRRARHASPRAHLLLAPYLGWTAFATVLAGSIARLNRR